MTRTFPGPGHEPGDGQGDGPATAHRTARSTRGERAVVLAGFAVASLWTAASFMFGAGTEAIGPLWLAAIAWAVVSSLALALRRGICRRDWSAFRRHRLPDNSDLVDWSRPEPGPTPTCGLPRSTNA